MRLMSGENFKTVLYKQHTKMSSGKNSGTVFTNEFCFFNNGYLIFLFGNLVFPFVQILLSQNERRENRIKEKELSFCGYVNTD